VDWLGAAAGGVARGAAGAEGASCASAATLRRAKTETIRKGFNMTAS
jgi:hypothetical protein